MIRSRRGPGLIGTAARTAVIAGTATRVSGSVAAKQQAQLQAQAQAQQRAQAQQQAATAPPPTAAGDTIGQLERLAALHQQGALTDAEFSAAKASLLGL